jgi:hypothetical protein
MASGAVVLFARTDHGATQAVTHGIPVGALRQAFNEDLLRSAGIQRTQVGVEIMRVTVPRCS